MDTSNDSMKFLSYIANNLYAEREYYFALKAFDSLEWFENESY